MALVNYRGYGLQRCGEAVKTLPRNLREVFRARQNHLFLARRN